MTSPYMVRMVALQRRERRRVRARGGLSLVLRVLGLLLLVIAMLTVSSAASAVGVAAAAYNYFTQDLPDWEQVTVVEENFETTKIYDRTGTVLLYELIDATAGDRQWVALDQISPDLIDATVAIEDRTFWENPGINPRGLMRAMWSNVRGEQIQGGSSITQQVIKNTLIPEEERVVAAEGPEFSDYERKVTEVLLAFEISRNFSKEQILEWYLNTNFYGNLAYGIEAAAQVYFDKHASELTLAEASTLAAIPQYPAQNPFDNPDEARLRQGLVLDAMEEQGYITAEQAVAAKYEPWQLAQPTQRFDLVAPHFAVYARQQLEEMFGPDLTYRGGLRVITTIDLDLQAQAECAARAHVRRLSGEDDATVVQQAIDGGCSAAQYLEPLRAQEAGRDANVHNAAVVSVRPGTGEIMAMVGSLDYWDDSIDGRFNIAADGLRQPGSSFKPFTYLTLLSQGDNAAHMFLDVRRAFEQPGGAPYVPENADRKYHGPQRMRLALARSYNIPAVEAMQLAGIDNVLRLAHRMGINTLDEGLDYYGLSLTLGGGEVRPIDMAYAFSVLANGGTMYGQPVPTADLRTGYRELDPVAILRVEDRSGQVMYEYQEPQRRDILSPQLAYLVTSMLSDPQARRAVFGDHLDLVDDRPAAAKTGTTNNYCDGWTVGYTPQLATAVWVGNTDNQPMSNLYGVYAAAPLWQAVMDYAHEGEEIVPFARPEGLEERTVCAISGHLPGPNCPLANELFIPGTEPTERCTLHQSFRVNRDTGKLCTAQTPPELCEERVFEVYPPEAADWIASLPEDRRPPIPPTEYDTTYGGLVSDAEVVILGPGPYSYLGHSTPITGSARGGDFNFYYLAFGQGLNPTEWIRIGPEHGEQVDRNVLEYWDITGLDGIYTLQLTVLDHAMNARVSTVQVTIDTEPPELDMTYPVDGQQVLYPYSDWINVNAEVVDKYSVARVEFYVNNNPEPFAVRTVAPFNVNWTLPGPGSHTFHVVAYDAAGNRAESDSATIYIVQQ